MIMIKQAMRTLEGMALRNMETRMLAHTSTKVVASPMPMPNCILVVTPNVGQRPSTRRNGGISAHRPFTNSCVTDFAMGISLLLERFQLFFDLGFQPLVIARRLPSLPRQTALEVIVAPLSALTLPPSPETFNGFQDIHIGELGGEFGIVFGARRRARPFHCGWLHRRRISCLRSRRCRP